MLRERAARAGLALVLFCVPQPQVEAATPAGYEQVRQLLSGSRKLRRQAARELAAAGELSLLPAMVDALFFAPRRGRAELLALLAELTGEEHAGYYDWVEYVARRPELVPPPGYLEWKLSLLARIDPGYGRVFYSGAPVRIRLEEVVWGGVPLDGIPALDDPPTIGAAEAGYLEPDERVFGVRLGGEARAYPLRILSWHEMLNDVVGGRPVTLSFCTLCGSGILYSTRTPAGGSYRFGTSGLLYRSNKLMFDRGSHTLWSNLTGEPVVGRLAASGVRLEMLPMTVTSWEDWRRLHPDTSVLALAPLARAYGGRLGFDYRPGAADRRRQGVVFPAGPQSAALERDAEVFGIRAGGSAKAYPVELLLRERVVNDRVGHLAVVLTADPESGAIRAYERGDHRFTAAASREELVDEEGRRWTSGESELAPAAGDAAPLPRAAGHLALWFGWHAFHPQTGLWAPERRPPPP